MAKTYDAVLKHLVEAYPAAWLAGVGWPTIGPVRVIDADVSTVTAGADKVLRVEEKPPWLMHLELQAGPDMELIDRAHLYNVVLRRRHGAPVRSAIVLLRREADSPRFTGLLEHLDPAGDWERRWRYRVIRVWQLSAEALLAGGLGLLPLAPITDDAADRLEDVVGRMRERLKKETSPTEAATLETSAFLLAGLRYPRERAVELFQGVQGMEESSTYQYVIEKGMEKGKKENLRNNVRRLGTRRFGAPDAAVLAALNGMDDLARLDRMFDRALDAADWNDLLATP